MFEKRELKSKLS